jgi:hypothetical protein
VVQREMEEEREKQRLEHIAAMSTLLRARWPPC